MERQEFINIAGIGCIQGILKGILDIKDIGNEVTIDGMFGPATIEGLEMAVKVGWRVNLPPYVDKRTFSSNDDYLCGIDVFQKWYKHVRDYMVANHEKKAAHWPVGESDGKWGDATHLMLLIVLAPLAN